MPCSPAVSGRNLGALALGLALLVAPESARSMPSHARARAAAAATCPTTASIASATLAESFLDFDQSSGGWRVLSDRACYGSAAMLIRRYLDARAAGLAPHERAILYFHLAQMLASAGERGAALAALDLSSAASAQQPRRFPSWDIYVRGTIAYLRRDRRSLEEAIHGLEATAAGQDGPAKVATELNLATLKGLRACFTKGYSVAYSPRCARARPHLSLPASREASP
jgi:hypothetical protein